MRKYKDIERLKDKYAPAFKVGEHITLTEKLDGANASILVNEDGTLTACSRRSRQEAGYYRAYCACRWWSSKCRS